MSYNDAASNIEELSDGVIDNEYDACSESGDLDISISKDIDYLIDSCHELHANVILANNLLSNIADKINRIQSINVIYEGDKIDFYELLELLHTNAINNIKEGRSNSFENQLLKAIDISVFA